MTKLSAQRKPLWERCGGRCEVSGRLLDYDTFDMHLLLSRHAYKTNATSG